MRRVAIWKSGDTTTPKFAKPPLRAETSACGYIWVLVHLRAQARIWDLGSGRRHRMATRVADSLGGDDFHLVTLGLKHRDQAALAEDVVDGEHTEAFGVVLQCAFSL